MLGRMFTSMLLGHWAVPAYRPPLSSRARVPFCQGQQAFYLDFFGTLTPLAEQCNGKHLANHDVQICAAPSKLSDSVGARPLPITEHLPLYGETAPGCLKDHPAATDPACYNYFSNQQLHQRILSEMPPVLSLMPHRICSHHLPT